MALDGCLQLIVIEYMDITMFRNIALYESAKNVEYIEVLCKATKEVRENWKHILDFSV